MFTNMLNFCKLYCRVQTQYTVQVNDHVIKWVVNVGRMTSVSVRHHDTTCSVTRR